MDDMESGHEQELANLAIADGSPNPQQQSVNQMIDGRKVSASILDGSDDESSKPTRRQGSGEAGSAVSQETDNDQFDSAPQRAVECACDCCAPLKRFPVVGAVLYWYLSVFWTDFPYLVCCAVYHFFNFALTLAIFIFVVTALSVSIPLIIIACIGVVLTWIVLESCIILARIDLGVAYHLLECNAELLNERCNELNLSLDNRGFPPFFACCAGNSRQRVGTLRDRVKCLFGSWVTYKILFYQLVGKPLITAVTCWSVLLPIICGFLMAMPFWYAAESKRFHNRDFCFFASDNNDDTGDYCDGWTINTARDVTLLFFIGLVLFPLCARISQYCADIARVCTYYWLTDLYSGAYSTVESRTGLLAGKESDGTAPVTRAAGVSTVSNRSAAWDML